MNRQYFGEGACIVISHRKFGQQEDPFVKLLVSVFYMERDLV